ncbi:HNH endonuclease [Mycobacterium interjectum]|uniref:HNH endonuclease n=1 Tax=Mycobacterium interjectum TaxID=33895 RepID=UPI000A3F3F9C|nr:HNH endonuclease [Mycobacterium interjectum]
MKLADGENHGEEWRAVPGHPLYEVSSLGRVRSYKRLGRDGRPRLASARPNPNGYPRAFVDGKLMYIHYLVALTWHGPRPEGMQVDHLNHKRDDNRVENLTYTTAHENRARTRVRPPATHCRRGHPLSGDNLYITPSNGRPTCRECRRRFMARRNSHDCYCGRPSPERKKARPRYEVDDTLVIEPTTPEVWRAIPGQPDYEASSHGRVRSYRRCRSGDRANFVPQIIKGYIDYEGYQRVTFGDGTRRYMHQIVAEVFIGPRPPDHEVSHINHVRHDNRAENLRYATRQDNLSDRFQEKAKTCKRGHPLTDDNVYVERRGTRVCRICFRRRIAKRDPNNCHECGEPLPERLRPLPH